MTGAALGMRLRNVFKRYGKTEVVHGIDLDVVGVCTGCDLRFRSHRRRVDLERHAMVAWFEEAS